MRYYQSSQHSFKQNQPKKSWFKRIFSRKRTIAPSPFSARYNNPYNRVKKKRKIPFKTIGVVLLILGWLSLMIYLPYFRITKTSVQGLRVIKQDEIQTVIDNYLKPHTWWPDNNYFLVREESLKKAIMEKFSVSDVQVKKVFPDNIEIIVEEKISSIIYDTGTGYYLLDQNGTVLKDLTERGEESVIATSTPTTTLSITSTTTVSVSTSTLEFPTSSPHVPDLAYLKQEYGEYPIIFDLREPIITDNNTPILNKTFIEGAIELFNAFKRAKLGSIKYAELQDPNAGLELITDKQWKIRVQPTHQVTTQIENISMIMKQYKPTEYIDVRFGERVYWK